MALPPHHTNLNRQIIKGSLKNIYCVCKPPKTNTNDMWEACKQQYATFSRKTILYKNNMPTCLQAIWMAYV